MHKIKDLTQQFSKDIEVNSKTIEARVTVDVFYDEYFNVNDFGNDAADLQRKIDRGILSPVVIQVSVHIEGYLFGFDSLSGVLIQHTESDVNATLDDNSMVETALNEAQRELTKFIKLVG